MTLPHFEPSDIANQILEPVYANLFELHFKYRDSNAPTYVQYIHENVFKYDLQSNRILMSMNFNEHLSIKKVCETFDNLSEVIIEQHKPNGSLTRRMILKMPESCLDNFSLTQDWNRYNEIVHLDVTIKYLNYEEIVPEQFIK